MTAFGSWFTAGRHVARDGSYVVADQVYVQHHVPERDQGRAPIVLLHGGGLSGAVWESTPDGRPGWAPAAVSAGWPVVIVDAVGAGRSSLSPDETEPGEWEWKTASDVWLRYRIGDARGWPRRQPFPGQQFPVEHFDRLLAAHVVRRRGPGTAELAAITEVVKRVGPCHLVAHSWSAHLVAEAFGALADGLLQVVLLEPVPFDPNVRLPMERVLLVSGDHFDHTEEPRWAGTAQAYRASSATHLDLNRAGIPGTSHMLMSDRTSNAVLTKVLTWLERP